MMARIFGIMLAGGVVLGLASESRAQYGLSGAGYGGTGFLGVGGSGPGYSYGGAGGGYGVPSYAYNSGYQGYATAYRAGSVPGYNSGYGYGQGYANPSYTNYGYNAVSGTAYRPTYVNNGGYRRGMFGRMRRR
jgi:hypothetical protein